MSKNYFVLFVRNLRRQKLFTIINLLGLTVSITSTLLIFLYVRHELSFDKFHNHADRIYRVNQTFIWGENDHHQFASTGPGVANALREELADAELITSVHTRGSSFLTYTNKQNEVISFEEERVLLVDTNFFKMFNFPLVKGDAATAMVKSQGVVMTASTARKYFGDEEPMGKLIRIAFGEEQNTYEVTGIAKDPPDNTYFKFDVLLSIHSVPVFPRIQWSWVWTQLETFVRLADNADIENAKTTLERIPRKHAEVTLQRVMNMSYDEYIKSGKKWELFFQPLTGIHLPEELVYNRISPAGNITVIYSLIGAAAFIVLLSCVNFMNLSTAQFMRRIKEASIRKILGIGRKELSASYLIEAVIFCTIAFVAALALVQMILPAFNVAAGKNLEINFVKDPTLILTLLGLVLGMAVLSGSYPAIFLSAFQPVEALKGKLRAGKEGKNFRNSLVVFQFSASIVLIICTSVVFNQLKFVSEKEIGFDKENLMVLQHVEHIKNGETLRDATLNVPGVKDATWCTSLPPKVWGGDSFGAEGLGGKTFNLNFTTADAHFVQTLGIKMKVGRSFEQNNLADTARVILNEAAIKRLGWKMDETVIGKKIGYSGPDQFEVVGVAADFNFWSLQANIEPMAIFHIKASSIFGEGSKKYIALRITGKNSEDWSNTIAEVQKLWTQHGTGTPFEYEFMDQTFAETFRAQEQFGDALSVMACLAILIASLGLLGMIVYALELRTKEIGIRKVSGASVWNILTLISKGYTKLILIAFLIGAPVSYWMMQRWLEDFAFRVTLSPWIFAIVGLGTLLVAIAITTYHSLKAAMMNPVEVLRDE